MLSKIVSPGDRIEIMKSVSEEKLKRLIEEKSVYAKPLISQVYDIIDDTQLSIAMPIVEGRVLPLPLNSKFEICFFTSGGLYKSGFIVTDRYKENGLYVLVIELLYELKKYQRRQYYRLECVMEVGYMIPDDSFSAEDMDDETIKKILDENILKKGIINDISGGGIRFSSNEKIEDNTVILVKLDMHVSGNKEVYGVMGKVLSSTKILNHDGLYEQRMEYHEIEENKRETIIRYIFEQERKMRQKL